MPPGNGLVSKWHGTDHPTCVAQLKSEPVITAQMSIAVGICLTHMVVIISFIGIVYKMADPIGELHAVLMMCGINDAVTCANIIAQEGFTQLGNLGVLETDTDKTEMAKRMATRTQAEGRVLLGTVMIK